MQALKYLKDEEMEKVQMELLEINRRIREQVWILSHGMNLAPRYHSSTLVCIYLGLFIITEFRNTIFSPCNHVTKEKQAWLKSVERDKRVHKKYFFCLQT